MVEIVPPSTALVTAIALDMRPDDVAEVYASGGYSPLDACVDAYNASTPDGEVHVALFDGQPAALYGVAKAEGYCVPWLLTTRLCDVKRRMFLRACKQEFKRMAARWPLLVNFVHVRHRSALPFAKRLGFKIGTPEPWGVLGDDFIRIEHREGAHV